MLILAFDTSLAACSAAVFDAARGALLASDWAAMERGHAETLPGMIETVMRASGAAMGDLDRIAVTRGPGTFTGVRIGLAMARGMGLALSRPVLGLSSLEAIAWNVAENPEQRPIVAAIDARRSEFYLQLFDHTGTAAGPARAVEHADAPACLPEGALLAGTGADLLGRLAFEQGRGVEPARCPPLPDAATIAPRVAPLDPAERPPEPIYLRPPDAKPRAAAMSASA